ncbi:MAG TPA: methyltransferase domain-containing protein [Ktedonobacteraceae bacterium]|nr:methyltransferase domain-containing protein [Ktedonobacteraceae bacterium]
MLYSSLLTCPICTTQLAQSNNTLICANAHTFDIAREGYINLLRKQLPGDTKEMLVARRSFLERGSYQPLSDTLNQLANTHLAGSTSPTNILDAGCGEGYYLGRLQQALADRSLQCVGFDISKEAIRLAARRYKQACFVVANLNERLVLADSALHMILNIFAPRNPAEFARVLVPGGLLLIAIPEPEHLLQLRSALHLLNIEEHKQEKISEQFAADFDFVTAADLSYTLHLKHAEIVQAVMMTPNYWHLSAEQRATMEGMEGVETTAAFTCLLFKRR